MHPSRADGPSRPCALVKISHEPKRKNDGAANKTKNSPPPTIKQLDRELEPLAHRDATHEAGSDEEQPNISPTAYADAGVDGGQALGQRVLVAHLDYAGGHAALAATGALHVPSWCLAMRTPVP